MGIGDKLIALRGNMTQAELSDRSGVDKAIISKIESGKMIGTVDCHKKLAQALGLRLSELYAYVEQGKQEPAEFHSAFAKTDTYKDFLEILTAIPLSKKMLPTVLTIKPGEEKTLEETLKRAEWFIMVLKGEVSVLVEGKTYKLKYHPDGEIGDSLYSRSNEKHLIKNTGNNAAKVLCVSSPPVL
jgi:transcriptional regulator with XRE-family HTH domain